MQRRWFIWGAAAGIIGLTVPIRDARASSFQTLYSFSGSDGATPFGKLVMDASGVLYGVTAGGGGGGGSGSGTIYGLDPSTRMLTTLYAFTGGADGSSPQSGLALDANGNLYGVTPTGGNTLCGGRGCGTIFRFNIAARKLTTLYDFTDGADGAQPVALLKIGASLYGSTIYGGDLTCRSPGCGTLFAYAIGSKSFTTVHTFEGADGIEVQGRLTRAPSGMLYGTASEAGPHGSGTDFVFDPADLAYSVVHGFDYHVDGSSSSGDLLFRQNFIYGTTEVGGPTAATDGTVYRLDPASGTLTTIHSFAGGNDGSEPAFGVVAGPMGQCFGATTSGGASGAGTLFAIKPATLGYMQVHVFDVSDGETPAGPLLYENGVLYGVTSGGGGGRGTVFEYVP